MDGIRFSGLKGADQLTTRFSREIRSPEGRKEDFTRNRRAARSCTSVNPELYRHEWAHGVVPLRCYKRPQHEDA